MGELLAWGNGRASSLTPVTSTSPGPRFGQNTIVVSPGLFWVLNGLADRQGGPGAGASAATRSVCLAVGRPEKSHLESIRPA